MKPCSHIYSKQIILDKVSNNVTITTNLILNNNIFYNKYFNV